MFVADGVVIDGIDFSSVPKRRDIYSRFINMHHTDCIVDSYDVGICSIDTFITIGEENIFISKRQLHVNMGNGGQSLSVHSVGVEYIIFKQIAAAVGIHDHRGVCSGCKY